LVEVKGQPKPVPSCYLTVAEGMDVTTASPKILDVRRQMLEFTLLNHPIDCPICDKAGECTLQRHYFDWDAQATRNEGIKVRKAKVVDVGKHIVLDQERCILCTRCIRVCNEVAKAPELTMAYRGSHEILTTAPGQRLDNPYSLNTVDVCPVGALTSKDFRFSQRAWELQSVPSICPGCATGCNIEVHTAREKIMRLVPRLNPHVNQYWMCDEGRFEYKAIHESRHVFPQIRGVRARFSDALAEAKSLLEATRGKVGVVLSASCMNEDLHAAFRLAVDELGVSTLFGAKKPLGDEDGILRSADKDSNTAGLRAMLGNMEKPLGDLERAAATGQIKLLLVVGDGPLPSIQLPTIALLSRKGTALDSSAVIFPLSMWAERHGTFTNKTGRVQRLHQALPAAGEALPGWHILAALADTLGKSWGLQTAKDVFTNASSRHPFLKNEHWEDDQAPVQLRFGDSRG
jgi:NADH-quinone oxidoreductase subunit G